MFYNVLLLTVSHLDVPDWAEKCNINSVNKYWSGSALRKGVGDNCPPLLLPLA